MKRTRHVLAIALVATALCADRAVAAAPALRPQAGSVAGRLVSRLSTSFRRVVPSVRVYETRRDGFAPASVSSIPMDFDSAGFRPRLLSPLQLRLPPPQR